MDYNSNNNLPTGESTLRYLFLALTCLLLISSQAFAQDNRGQAPGNKYVKFSVQYLKDQRNEYLALNYQNTPKWHTYWKNPGDAGIPIKAKFYLNGKEFEPKALEWPAPKRFIEEGNILSYGYKDSYTLFYRLNEKQKKRVKEGTLKVESSWLVCKDICIHGQKQVELQWQDQKLQRQDDTREINVTKSELIERLKALPQKANASQALAIFLNKGQTENNLFLYFSLEGVSPGQIRKDQNVLTPFPQAPFNFKQESLYYDQRNNTLYGSFEVEWDGKYMDPPIALPEDGSFEKAHVLKFVFQNPFEKTSQVINYSIHDFALADIQKVKQTLEGLDQKKSPSNSSKTTLIQAILLAFFGGIILNLMPCVLPVISLKLFGLIKHSRASKKKIKQINLFYTLGVLASFWALAGIIIILKASGEFVGWGFQLQSPLFLVIMMMLLFIFSLNLFGLFEFSTPGGRFFGNLETKNDNGGSFLSGVLATILSTPCSAPFLGTALTFAFTMGSFNIFLIFTFVGLGLAFPFILTAFFPKLVSFLPKPGLWMEKLKYFLGFALVLTTIWLLSVYANIVNSTDGMITLILHFLMLFIGFFGLKKVAQSYAGKLIFTLLILYALFSPILNYNKAWLQVSEANTQFRDTNWQKWSPQKMKELKGKKLFIDFTADWCLTCKVNKKLVLETEDFKQYVKKNKITLLRADWTKRDEVIGNWLAQHNVVGIPAYFYQKANGDIIYLGETISIDSLNEAI